MPFLSQLETMVKEFLESERPETYRRMKAAGELDDVAKMRAKAADESFMDRNGEISDRELKEIALLRKTDPLARIRYMAMRESRIVEVVLSQMLDFPSEGTEQEDETI